MIGYRQVVYGLVFTLVLHGCSWVTGTNVYVNEQYDTKPKPASKLAIVPLTRLARIIHDS